MKTTPTINELAQAQSLPWRQIHRGSVTTAEPIVRYFAIQGVDGEVWDELNATTEADAVAEAAQDGYTHVAPAVCISTEIADKAVQLVEALDLVERLDELLFEHHDFYVSDDGPVLTPTTEQVADLNARVAAVLRAWLHTHPTAVNTTNNWQVRTHEAVEVAPVRSTERAD